MDTKKAIKKKAREIGFDLVGVTNLKPSIYQEEYIKWIEEGMHADMVYLERRKEQRLIPHSRFPWAKSVIVLGVNYWQGPLPKPKKVGICISRYALGRDYHYVLSKMLFDLSNFIKSRTEVKRIKYYTDTGSLLEKELAQRAGLGWTGKNTLLITEEFGSWIFLGEIIVDIELEVDKPKENKCGNCKICLDSCPSSALVEPFRLNTNRCTAYQTVENLGKLPEWFPSPGNLFIFGCDICQEVCPFNKNAKMTEIEDFIPNKLLINPSTSNLLRLKDKEFEKIFSKTPIGWRGRKIFMRNLKSVKNGLAL
ncbi:MAG: tRNA epoxyqueuosine(34) reductase QueG [candidate division WOR-3 bacterium]|nr:tRNA epoxyqueuosine(34) reductase QueG [candidate division WOR-3 bacterium]